jgi:hypothetical protein
MYVCILNDQEHPCNQIGIALVLFKEFLVMCCLFARPIQKEEKRNNVATQRKSVVLINDPASQFQTFRDLMVASKYNHVHAISAFSLGLAI